MGEPTRGGLPLGLIAANLVPIVCVGLFRWDVTQLMLCYWAENVVIGLFNMAKMAAAGVAGKGLGLLSAAVSIPLFAVHYGLFCLGHGFLILVMSAMAARGGQTPIPLSDLWAMIMNLPVGFGLSVGSMVLSHGRDFANWLGQGQARATTPSDQMFEPYGRIGVLQLALMGGMGLMLIVHQSTGAVLLLGIGKLVLELARRRHAIQPDVGAAPVI